jgi:hypothetical protein
MFDVQPELCLDFFFEPRERRGRYGPLLDEFYLGRHDPFARIGTDQLISWAQKNPEPRFKFLVRYVGLFAGGEDAGSDLSPSMVELLKAAPEPGALWEALTDHLHPSGGWAGSTAELLERRARSIEPLASPDFPGGAAWVSDARTQLEKWAIEYRRRENQREQTFE